jgi:hypothetical protein
MDIEDSSIRQKKANRINDMSLYFDYYIRASYSMYLNCVAKGIIFLPVAGVDVRRRLYFKLSKHIILFFGLYIDARVDASLGRHDRQREYY